MTQFSFFASDFPDISNAARRSEQIALSDPRGACFYARLALETALKWMYRSDPARRSPYDDNLSALIHEPSLQRLTGPAFVAKAKFVKDQGNRAVHDSRPVSADSATATVRELFHICYWLARTYAKGTHPPDDLSFDPGRLEKTLTTTASTAEKVRQLQQEHQGSMRAAAAAEEARRASEDGRRALGGAGPPSRRDRRNPRCQPVDPGRPRL